MRVERGRGALAAVAEPEAGGGGEAARGVEGVGGGEAGAGGEAAQAFEWLGGGGDDPAPGNGEPGRGGGERNAKARTFLECALMGDATSRMRWPAHKVSPRVCSCRATVLRGVDPLPG